MTVYVTGSLLPDAPTDEVLMLPPKRPKLNYAVGDRCWIAMGAARNEDTGESLLIPARVMAKIVLPHHVCIHYVVELDVPDWQHLEIRDALLMSETEEGPLAYNALCGPRMTQLRDPRN